MSNELPFEWQALEPIVRAFALKLSVHVECAEILHGQGGRQLTWDSYEVVKCEHQ